MFESYRQLQLEEIQLCFQGWGSHSKNDVRIEIEAAVRKLELEKVLNLYFTLASSFIVE